MKDSCCCGATKQNPCECMKEGHKCSMNPPRCPCYKLLNAQKKASKELSKSFDDSWNVVKRKRPYCPYCKGHLNFASGEWNDKHCTTCNRWVKPFYAP